MSKTTAESKDDRPINATNGGDRDGSRIHRRQLIIGPHPVETFPGWTSFQLAKSRYLSHCSDLRVLHATDSNGLPWHLLGLAVQTIAERPDPVDDIAVATLETVPRFYHSWAGRWLLVGADTVHMDCSGLLGCFYGTVRTDKGKELWVSSSPALLAEVLGVGTRPSYRIEHGFGIDWYCPPGSGIDSINRLLPSQLLHLSNGEVSSRQLIPFLPPMAGYEKILDEIQDYFISILKRVDEVSDRLWLAMTGGNDSRTFLAAAKYAGVPVKPYTHSHKNLSKADQTLPPQLAATVGMDHVFFKGGAHNRERETMFDQHTAGHSVDRDRFYFSHDYFNWCRRGDTILRSHCIEIGRWARDRFPVEEFGTKLLEAEEIIGKYKERGFQYAGKDSAGYFPPALHQALDEWVAWSKAWPQEEIDWRDRFWIEQCLAGWLSSIEQSLDLIDAERFYATNSQRFFALVLQVPEQLRLPKKPMHQRELIRRMAPELLEFPFNPPDPLPFQERIIGKFRILIERVFDKTE